MAANTNSVQSQEVVELRNRIEWLDEERRKLNRKVAEMEQRFDLQQRDLKGREQRIQDLERQMATITTQLTRVPQVDTKLSQFKDEMVELIEQYDARRVKAEDELDRLRRIEHEGIAREIGDIRKELPAINRLARDMELRQAEEARLANLIGVQQGKIAALDNQVEEWDRSLSFLSEKERQNSRNLSELQANILEINKRWSPVYDRLDILNSTVMRLENSFQELEGIREEVYDRMKSWMEQIQVGEHERNKQLESWRYVLEEHADTIERFAKEWITFSDQYKEAKMAVQTLSEWQKQVEQTQREASELLRIESHRMQARWDNFLQENQKRWKNFEVESEQRWHGVNRRDKQIQEQLMAIDELLTKLQQDKDLLWRVQTAQADAIKKLPRIWAEEVEKAMDQNPNRRRQPALVPVREE